MGQDQGDGRNSSSQIMGGEGGGGTCDTHHGHFPPAQCTLHLTQCCCSQTGVLAPPCLNPTPCPYSVLPSLLSSPSLLPLPTPSPSTSHSQLTPAPVARRLLPFHLLPILSMSRSLMPPPPAPLPTFFDTAVFQGNQSGYLTALTPGIRSRRLPPCRPHTAASWSARPTPCSTSSTPASPACR